MYMTTQHTAMMTPVETRMLPIPVNGDTIPPKRNWVNPKRAEALPAFFRSISRARAVDVGSTIPNETSRRKSKLSTRPKGISAIRAAAAQSPRTKNPEEPTRNALCAVRKRGTKRLEPTMIPNALAPKQILYIRGET